MRLEREGVGWVQIPGKVKSVPGRLVCARIEKRSRTVSESSEERNGRQWKAWLFVSKVARLSTAHVDTALEDRACEVLEKSWSSRPVISHVSAYGT